jgi:hypothetical protein
MSKAPRKPVELVKQIDDLPDSEKHRLDSLSDKLKDKK